MNKEKRIRQRLHEQLLAKKKKFDIQSRSLSKFQQDSFGFEDYESEEDQIMFLESETLEHFIGKKHYEMDTINEQKIRRNGILRKTGQLSFMIKPFFRFACQSDL